MTRSLFDLGMVIESRPDLARSKLEQHKPVYMYHVSPEPLHDDNTLQVKMEPKVIWSGEDAIYDVKRICVAPTIEQCLVAICPRRKLKHEDRFYVYRTKTKVSKTGFPWGVMDATLTQERWIRTTRMFLLVAEVPRSCDGLATRYNDFGYTISLDFLSRGGQDDFPRQQNELYRLRSWFKKHDHLFFSNKLEKKRHDNQKAMKLRLNRDGYEKLRASGSY